MHPHDPTHDRPHQPGVSIKGEVHAWRFGGLKKNPFQTIQFLHIAVDNVGLQCLHLVMKIQCDVDAVTWKEARVLALGEGCDDGGVGE